MKFKYVLTDLNSDVVLVETETADVLDIAIMERLKTHTLESMGVLLVEIE